MAAAGLPYPYKFGNDIFAVLCPAGPLKLLLDLAAERNEEIPALIYTAGMADIDDGRGLTIGYRTQDNKVPSNRSFSWFGGSRSGYERLQAEESRIVEEERHPVGSSVSLPCEDEDTDDINALKLGLGDFIFYSVLIGKAAGTFNHYLHPYAEKATPAGTSYFYFVWMYYL
ncbi:hypothetical protein EC973_002595 [Apophysomyces ossiformis]|uniref:Uncharacterized protein n=1 Tax=Apophysomyces ossiformis TaxID=679940 RepID=A0A8H7BNI0_9FUNG|nr:hypothetical protein EC973_002595 [Apophysomyces ossiformis]